MQTISYAEVLTKVTIVPVNGAGSGITQSELQKRLNEIYGPAVASWQVEVMDNQTLTGWDDEGNGLDDGETGMLSNYTDEMNALIRAFKAKHKRARDTYYLFLVDRAENTSKLGYMPRKKQWGFVFTESQSANQLITTIAHELGHGVFRLEHTFSEKGLPKGQTDNLMDYSPAGENDKKLYKYQWDHVHDPASVVTLFDDEEDGAMVASEELQAFLLLSKHGKAAKLLAEHLRKLEIFSHVHALVDLPDGTSDVIVAIEYDQSNRVEFVIESFNSQSKFFDILVFDYGINYSAYVAELSDDWVARVYWSLRNWEDEFSQGQTYANTYVELGSRISAGVAFTLYGWWTDEDLLTGQDIAWWEHALGVLDIAEIGTVGKATLGLEVLKIGGRTLKIAELSKEVRKVLAHSFAEGVTFVLDEGALVLQKSGVEIGRIVDGTLQVTKILPEGRKLSDAINGYYLAVKDGAYGFVALSKVSETLAEFLSKSLPEKYEDIARAWKVYYPKIFFERRVFEEMMGYYRYLKSSGWSHTSDISPNFKAIDFFIASEFIGNSMNATKVVSMKTTTVTDVGTWLGSEPVKKNISFLLDGFEDGISYNGKTILYDVAEVHVYFPKEKFSQELVDNWQNILLVEYPELKFRLNTLEEFVK